MATSFKKRGANKSSSLQGTRPSLQNSQLLLVSTGVPSIDALLGGGQPIGSILLIEEDTYELYSRVLMKYYIAEGIMCGHYLFLSSASERPVEFLTELPGPVYEDKKKEMDTVVEEESEEEMKIAWRYQNLSKVKALFSNQFGHNFDLTSKMDMEKIHSTNIKCADFTESQISSLEVIYAKLAEELHSETFLKNSHTQQVFIDVFILYPLQSVLRIVIQSLGSPLWMKDTSSLSTNLTCFLHTLQYSLHKTNAVAMVTMPTHLFQNESYVRRIERLCDSVVRLESFAGSDKEHNPLYKEYHGLFHLIKSPRIQSLTCHYPETLDLAFKLKRKKFTVEKLHLPPELSETVNRAQEETEKQRKKPPTSGSIDF